MNWPADSWKATLLCAAASFALDACSTFVADDAVQLQQTQARAGTQILVTVPQSAPSTALGLTGSPGQTYQRQRGYGPAPSIDRGLDRIARQYDLRRIRGWAIDSVGVYCEVFEVSANRDADEVIARLLQDPRIDVAQRMNVFETLANPYNDPFADLQTSVRTLDVGAAHKLATGRGVTIAVIDSQIDTRHPELRNSIRYARDLVDNGLVTSPEIHGTAVAGIIASAANNTEGIVGIAPDVGIAALRACWSINSRSSAARCTSFSLAQALEVALELRTEIINLSLSGPQDPLLARILEEAISRGVIVVAASAEDNLGPRGFPASHPGVIAVRSAVIGEVMRENYLLRAPGSEILTTTPAAGYGFFSGNSVAAAHVSGVAALLLERNPAFDADALVALLNETTGTIDGSDSINACRALARLVAAGSCMTDPQRSAMAIGAH